MQTFVRMFPRCGVPDVFGDWSEHRRFVAELLATNCIREFTQIWWSVRPHHKFGTVEIRICDAQTETLGRASPSPRSRTRSWPLCCGATTRESRCPVLPTRYVEENLWRAIRYGLDGKLVAWPELREVAAPDAVRALVDVAAPEAERLGCAQHLAGVGRLLEEGNGAQRQVRAYHEGKSLVEVYRETVLRAHADAGVPVAPSELGV